MMAEQRPEQPVPKIDTEGYVGRGAGAFEQTNKQVGRLGSFLRKHPVVQKVAAVGAFVGLGGIAATEVTGCGPGEENTTKPPGITSTQVPGTQPGSSTSESGTTLPGTPSTENPTTTKKTNEATTTKPSIATTTEAPTTTTTEAKNPLNGLISETKTLEDVDGHISEYKRIEASANVPDELQAQFRVKNPDYKLLYVGEKNRGGEMNAVITDKPLIITWHGGDQPGTVFGAFGGIPSEAVGGKIASAVVEFIDTVEIPEINDEGLHDFYIHGQANGEDVYVRIDVGAKLGNWTAFGTFDLNERTQNGDEQAGSNYLAKNFLKKHSLSELIQPGDTIIIYLNPDRDFSAMEVDERGVMEARGMVVTRLEGINDVKALFNN